MEKAINTQDIQLLFKNLYIYANYETVVKEYNSGNRNYIREPKKIYEERVLNSLEKIFNGKSEEEIIDIFRNFNP